MEMEKVKKSSKWIANLSNASVSIQIIFNKIFTKFNLNIIN
jgi:hypothetical protein